MQELGEEERKGETAMARTKWSGDGLPSLGD